MLESDTRRWGGDTEVKCLKKSSVYLCHKINVPYEQLWAEDDVSALNSVSEVGAQKVQPTIIKEGKQ